MCFQEVTSNKKRPNTDFEKCCGLALIFIVKIQFCLITKGETLYCLIYEFIEKKHRFKRYYFILNNVVSVKIKFKNSFMDKQLIYLAITGYQQNHQVTEFLEKINLNERNLVCGDLNSLESYSCITKLKNNFKIGLVSKTFPSLYPLYQIDHVLYNDISDITCHTLDSTLSDHLPVLIEIF